MKWLALMIAVAWILWVVRVWRTVTRQPGSREPYSDREVEEARRRDALGRVTYLEAHRQLARHDPGRSARWAARRQ